MRHYEIVLVVHPDRSEQIPNMLKRYRAIIEDKNGIIHRLEDWGRRSLAYQIRKVYKGHYILMNLECSSEILTELEHAFKFNDAILRHLIIKMKNAITEASVMLKDSEKTKNLLAVDRNTIESKEEISEKNTVSIKNEEKIQPIETNFLTEEG